MEWISVKERLPDNEKYVLVADFNYQPSEGLECENYFIGYYRDGSWVASTDETWVKVYAGWNGGVIQSDVNQSDVTHWMPLPQPPQ